MKSAEPCLEVTQLSISMGSELLLDTVNLKIHEGERLAIIGANGAGKTTLLRCLLGLLQPDTGQINLYGKNISALTRGNIARNIAYVPQVLNPEIHFSVHDFIAMSRYSHSGNHHGLIATDNNGKEIADTMMQRTGIQHLAHRSMSTLSGGERQKASIAAALTQQSPILILDEPAAHLDPKQQDSVQTLLEEISQSNNHTIITVTHDLNWAASCFDRLIGLKNGRVISDSTPQESITTENLAGIFETQWEILPHPRTGSPMVIR